MQSEHSQDFILIADANRRPVAELVSGRRREKDANHYAPEHTHSESRRVRQGTVQTAYWISRCSAAWWAMRTPSYGYEPDFALTAYSARWRRLHRLRKQRHMYEFNTARPYLLPASDRACACNSSPKRAKPCSDARSMPVSTTRCP